LSFFTTVAACECGAEERVVNDAPNHFVLFGFALGFWLQRGSH
jgi:hypothetical protein